MRYGVRLGHGQFYGAFERRCAAGPFALAYNTRGMHQQTIAALEKYLIPALPCAAR